MTIEDLLALHQVGSVDSYSEIPEGTIITGVITSNMNGKVVYALDGTHNGTIEVNVSGWSAGVYFVNLRNNDTVVTKKLVVTK